MAFAEQRLTDEEFDQRIRAALTARTTAELDQLTADLPAQTPGLSQAGLAAPGRKPGRFVVTFKNSIRRSGRWSVPRKLTFGVYKGSGAARPARRRADARPVTTIRAVIYKSRSEIVLPPGVRLELGGLGVSSDCDPAAQSVRPRRARSADRGLRLQEPRSASPTGPSSKPDAAPDELR